MTFAKIEAGKMEQLGPVKLDELFSALEDFTSTRLRRT